MNIEDKKTALDDDSLLYQKRDDSLGKKDTASLTGKQKAAYFKDYYLKTVLAVLAVAAIVLSLINTMVFHRQTRVLSVALLGEAAASDLDSLQETLRTYYGLTSEDDYIALENYYLEDPNMQMKFATMIGAQAIDILVCPQEDFETYAAAGYFADLSEALPAELYGQFDGLVREASIEKTDENGNVTGTLPAAPYGIDITDNSVYLQYGGAGEKAILGISSNSENLENAVSFVRFLADPSAEAAQAGSPQT